MYMAKRIKISEDTFEKINLMKQHFRDVEESMGVDDPRELGHRNENGHFDRDYMVRRAIENFLIESDIEF